MNLVYKLFYVLDIINIKIDFRQFEKYPILLLSVQYLGSTEVDKPKGIEVVKDGIRKLKFSQQLKKAEGTKTPKVSFILVVEPSLVWFK